MKMDSCAWVEGVINRTNMEIRMTEICESYDRLRDEWTRHLKDATSENAFL